ncbi:MAG: DUF4350 domain-containing protein [Oscillatoriales cyanobacterium]|nr:MAG: DUF4350 domain-containing protein [Oscillatoriales cyanobacterium]TAH21330.1 MAG: DUF4350 domain-containing protein [Oscillatoriales cyanobacterium]
MNLSNRRLWLLGAIAITAIIIITLVFAPASNKLNSGSTYNRGPDGYGAWHDFMTKRGTKIERWQKSVEDFAKNPDAKQSSTLLRIYSSSIPEVVSDTEENWVKQGNTLVILGVRAPVTAAPFSSLLPASAGEIKIDTGRRVDRDKKPILGDKFGGIVWGKRVGKGTVYFGSAPHLAANAYQDFPGNYEFLAGLVTQSEGGGKEIEGTEQALAVNFIQNPIDRSQKTSPILNKVWVDEYIHGYKDPEIVKREYAGNLFTYLAKTPLFPVLIQGTIILIVAIFAGWNRFGQPITISAPQVDNSEAYIQALAGVLEKANSTDFAVETIGKAEKLQLQKALLLGQASLESDTLTTAWEEQTGRKAAELTELVRSPSRKSRISDRDLLAWLGKWEQIRQHLSSNKKNPK